MQKNKFITLLLVLILSLTFAFGCTNLSNSSSISLPNSSVSSHNSSFSSDSDNNSSNSSSSDSSSNSSSNSSNSSNNSSSSSSSADDYWDEDPYVNVNEYQFYANYTPAVCYEDAVYRTKHYLMSGDITDQDQAPTICEKPLKEGNLFVKNSHGSYSLDKNTYYVVDVNGDIVKEIYRGGAYVTLEDVAAYLFAFNEIPANYTTSKYTKPTSSKWGKYLRLNHSKFNGSTTKYPYEPELPNISGCGGTYQYYELDVGTTGTSAGSDQYAVGVYNNGTKITRGAARIVYSNSENGKAITDLSKKYLFYTYNHYNDFQEYLNYYNGWGEMFGNITGGGTLSSKSDYNPTPYVSVVLKDFSLFSTQNLLSVFDKYLVE